MCRNISTTAELVELVYPMVRGLANSWLRRKPCDADDVVQNTMVLVLQHADKLIERANNPDLPLRMEIRFFTAKGVSKHFGRRRQDRPTRPKTFDFSALQSDDDERPYDPVDPMSADDSEPGDPPSYVSRFLDALPGAPQKELELIVRIALDGDERHKMASEAGISPRKMNDRYAQAKRWIRRHFTAIGLLPPGVPPELKRVFDPKYNARKRAERARINEANKPGIDWVRLSDVRAEVGYRKTTLLRASILPAELRTYAREKYISRDAYNRFLACP